MDPIKILTRAGLAAFLTIFAFIASRASAADQASPPAVPAPFSKLEIFSQGYPRAFYFWTNTRRRMMNPAADWRTEFMGLQGVSTPCEYWPQFLEFKAAHPEMLVYLFTQGHVFSEKPSQYDPIDRERLFAGHWVYFEGCRLTADVPAEEGETVLHVAAPRCFNAKTFKGKRTIREDVALCALDSAGRPDWNRCEQVRLLAVDPQAKTIKVARALYGTRPLAFKAGQAWAAAHAYQPWGYQNGISWVANFSPYCPKDSAGKNATDHLVEQFAALFEPGGTLASYDGLEFDAFMGTPSSAGRAGRGVDTDGDGRADGGLRDGINVYGLGVYDFIKRLRDRLGDSKLIMGDGSPKPEHQRCFGLLNGIESEWWPQWTDLDVSAWSSGMNLHEFWRQNSRAPYFSYFVHKIGGEDARAWNNTPFHLHRLVLAAAQFLDAAVTTFYAPPMENGETLGSFDELRKGVERQPGWLGQPRGPAVRLALASPDLLRGAGKSASPVLLRHFTGEGVRFEADGEAVKITGAGTAPAKPGQAMLTFSITGLPCSGEDLLVAFTIKAAPRPGYPELMPRHVDVTTSAGQPAALSTFANPRPFAATFYFRKVRGTAVRLDFAIEGTQPVWISNISVHAHPDTIYREFDKGLVLANPSDHNASFDLSSLVPGAPWKRFQGSSRQDPQTNNGQPVTGSVTLGPRDGLFLVRQ